MFASAIVALIMVAVVMSHLLSFGEYNPNNYEFWFPVLPLLVIFVLFFLYIYYHAYLRDKEEDAGIYDKIEEILDREQKK